MVDSEESVVMYSFSRRLTRRIVLALTLALAVVTAGVFYQASWIMEYMASAYYEHIADIENESVEKKLHDVEVAVRNSIDEVEWQLVCPDSVYIALKDKLGLNPKTVLGFGAAFIPNYYPEEGPWFEPYAVWRDGEVELMQIGDMAHDYFEMEWYRKGLESDSGHWSDPYHDETATKMLLCTYSVPIHDGKGRKVGVFGGDLSLDMLHEYLKKKDEKANTEGILRIGRKMKDDPGQWVRSIIVGREGDYISHPEKSRILHGNFYEEVSSKEMGSKEIVSDMKAGKKGAAKAVIDGVEATVFYTPLEHTGWTLAVILPEDRLKAVVINLCINIASVLLLGLLAVYIISRMTIRHATRPLHFLAKSADEVAKGNFNAPLPEIHHDDEIRQLRDSFGNMQQSLSRYINELQTTTAQKSAIESELAIARNIQMSMLPTAFPDRPDLSIHAMLTPAKAVGGDLYDFFLEGNHLYFCIGDVSGKGVPAALVMATACGAFRLLSESKYEPQRIVHRMNEMITRNNSLSVFITFFAGVLDLETGHLSYCNAGHKAPVLISSKEVSSKEVSSKEVSSNMNIRELSCDRNLPVGAMPDWKFTAQETIIAPGTTLFLYTDGVDEAENVDRQLFGKERVRETLRSSTQNPRELIEYVSQAVGKFVGDTEQSDDLTMMAILVKGEG